MKKDNPLLEKSLKSAAGIVKLYQYLVKEKKESIISKQIIIVHGIGIGSFSCAAAGSHSDFDGIAYDNDFFS